LGQPDPYAAELPAASSACSRRRSRTLAQLESAIRAVDVTLDAGTRAKLDAIFPGPGGPAPEVYFW